MSEETLLPNETKVEAALPAAVAASPSVNFKDFLIPISIVIAGLIIGLGLYLSAGSSNNNIGQGNGAPTPAAKTTGDTTKIDPVTEADHIKGNPAAPVKIVEYSDFECPFCQRHHNTLQTVLKKYGDKVAWVYRQYPIEQLHKKAMPVAIASECVAELGGNTAFWTFTDGYFRDTLTNDRTDIEVVIPALVAEAGVNKVSFDECFNSGRHTSKIETNMADAIETGGQGTPWSVVIGPTGKTYAINGSQSAATIEKTIDLAIEEGS